MLTDPHIKIAEQEFHKAIEHLKAEYAKLQAGRANVSLVEDIKVEAYGGVQPLKALSSILIPEAKVIQIQPWDKHILSAMEKAIIAANIGLTPTNDGVLIRIVIPSLTEERRRELAKKVGQMAEEARIHIRHARQQAHNAFRDLEQQKQITEDERRLSEKHLQEKVDKVNLEIDEAAKAKEEAVLRV